MWASSLTGLNKYIFLKSARCNDLLDGEGLSHMGSLKKLLFHFIIYRFHPHKKFIKKIWENITGGY
jgi:hypothetical protein